jgi:hypothetical protein
VRHAFAKTASVSTFVHREPIMPKPRLLILSLLAIVAACASPEPRETGSGAEPARSEEQAPAAEQSAQRLVSTMAEQCRDAVAGHQNAVVTGSPRAALVREDWVQVDGTMEWRGEEGVLRNAWTCDMFRGEDGQWHRRYLSFGPA